MMTAKDAASSEPIVGADAHGGCVPLADAEPGQRPRRSQSYSAVIFVHGMGPQARHENVGQLLEALEEFCNDPETGVLRKVKPRLEPSRVGDEDDVPFIQMDRFVLPPRIGDRRWSFRSRTRAYEAYWSPITARGARATGVAVWALSQLWRPLVVGAGNWREYTRLRIARLHSLLDGSTCSDAFADPYIVASLFAQIRRFRGHEGRRHQQKTGRADQESFSAFVSGKLGSSFSQATAAAIARWGAALLPVERLTRSTAMGLCLMGVALSGFTLAIFTTGTQPSVLILWITALLTLGILSIVGRFLAFTFSDVFIWNSNRHHDRDFDRRNAVLRQTRSLFEHVLADPNCKRVVIVSHSLGSAIALETLCHIGQRNIARQGIEAPVRLSKISHLFTLGSPIDKIFYFFQTREARTYRAGRLNDDLRGDLSQEPFFRGDRQRLKWLNLWDNADPVSDPLYSALGAETAGSKILSGEIENHRVENTRTFSAWKNHVGYLQNPDVIETLADAIFLNQTSPPPTPSTKRSPLLGQAIRVFAYATPWTCVGGASLAALDYWTLGLLMAFLPTALLFLVLTTEFVRRGFADGRRRAKLKAR